MKSSRLSGHTLRRGGRALDAAGRFTKVGRGKCDCGMVSPVLPSTVKRQQWHRDHKADLRAGGDGNVWADADWKITTTEASPSAKVG